MMINSVFPAPTTPEASIITPLFNGESFFSSTIDSIRSQTFQDFEWIIVNDNSTDGTREILDELMEHDRRVQVIHLDTNHGPIFARNCAMEVATGRFVAFLDGDDLWLPEKLEKQVSYMKRSGAHLTYTSYRKITKTGSYKSGRLITPPSRAPYSKILQSDYMMASSVVFDTNITGRIFQSYEAPIGKDDFHFFLSILKKHGPAHGIPEDLARLRVHNGSITGNKMKSARLQWCFYRNTLDLSFFSALAKYVVYAVKGLYKHLL